MEKGQVIYEDEKFRVYEPTEKDEGKDKGYVLDMVEGEEIYDARTQNLGMSDRIMATLKFVAKKDKEGKITGIIKIVPEYEGGKIMWVRMEKVTPQEWAEKTRETEEKMQPITIGNPTAASSEEIGKVWKAVEEKAKEKKESVEAGNL